MILQSDYLQNMILPEDWELLPVDFYARPTETVARELLNTYLVHFSPAGVVAGRVVETEAYLGPGDPASHSARGMTKRNAVMFGPSGRAYIYFIYGVHYCFNATTGDDQTPAAVLIRSLEPVLGIDLMISRRGTNKLRQLCSGPGKLVQALEITAAQNGTSLVNGPIRFYRGDLSLGAITATTRVGISKAAELPLRFYVRDCAYISRK